MDILHWLAVSKMVLNDPCTGIHALVQILPVECGLDLINLLLMNRMWWDATLKIRL